VIEIADKLSAEDLGRFRMALARNSAIEYGVAGYSPREAEESYMALWKMVEEFTNTYGLDEALNWNFDPHLGHIWREA
jgi:hypothetical protein